MSFIEFGERYSEPLSAVRSQQRDGEDVYVVGGAVRDAILGQETHDIDFAVRGNARRLARRVADVLCAVYVEMDDEHDIGRVILDDQSLDRFILDFAALRADDLEGDLLGRDFKINAMALDVKELGKLIDPLGGIVDLQQKVISACSPTSITDDPIRVLRAIRLAIGLNFKIEPGTLQQIRLAVSSLPRISNERQRDELFRILEGPRPDTALKLLDAIGCLEVVLPEIAPLKGFHQSEPHIFDVWEHTLATVQKLDSIYAALVEPFDERLVSNLTLGTLVLKLGPYRQRLADFYSQRLVLERNLKPLLMLAAIYHDSGKPNTLILAENGKTHFFGHESVGREKATLRGQTLALSNAEIQRIDTIIQSHMRIHFLARDKPDVDKRSIFRFFRKTGSAGIDVCLLSLADILATFGPSIPQDKWLKEVDAVQRLFEGWFDQPEKVIKPVRLITGHDIQADFHLSPGPLIGQLLEFVQEAQVVGEVTDRQQALEWVGDWLKKNLQNPGGFE